MALEILWLIIGLAIGFAIAWYFISQQKWGDKARALEESWKRKLSESEKDSELRLAKLTKDWQVKYINDIAELKKLFKESEKTIRLKSVSSSRRSLIGKFIEKFVPFIAKVPYEASDMHFLGQPVDYIVFEGLGKDDIKKVVFLEVKTGKSKLNKREKSLKDTVEKKKVYWKEMNINVPEKGKPDKEMETEETAIKELYGSIDSKIRSVGKNAVAALNVKEEESEDEQGEYEETCPKCGGEFTFELEEGENLKKGVKVECPHCGKTMTAH